MYDFDKDKVKSLLTIDDIYTLLEDMGASPIRKTEDIIIAQTICHDGDSHKLYYYDNQTLFNCYTHCGLFDVFELVIKLDKAPDLNEAVRWIVAYFQLWPQLDINITRSDEISWIEGLYNKDDIEIVDNLNYRQVPYDDAIFLKNLPRPIIIDWINDNISKEVCDYANICYDPIDGNIVIPHYDIDNNLIGIRRRALSQKNIEKYGKYRPLKWKGREYNHKTGFNLYGINWAKDAISKSKMVFVYEAEKSVLQHMTCQGIENTPAVATCGQNLSQFQFNLLYSLGVKEICVCFDKDFKEYQDKDWQKCLDKYAAICGNNKGYCNYVNMSFIFDEYGDILDYKQSPIEKGWAAFYELFKNRFVVN